MTLFLPQCMNCQHFLRFADARRGTCAAFPDGIPNVIMQNVKDHRQPLAGDHGVQWKAKDPGVPHPLALEETHV